MSSLKTLAQEFFSDFTAAERKLVEAAPLGQFAICGINSDDSDPSNNPRNAADWDTERQIRADLIRWI
jgi:hypothetical protein